MKDINKVTAGELLGFLQEKWEREDAFISDIQESCCATMCEENLNKKNSAEAEQINEKLNWDMYYNLYTVEQMRKLLVEAVVDMKSSIYNEQWQIEYCEKQLALFDKIVEEYRLEQEEQK